MKKKFLLIGLTVIMAVCCALGFAACRFGGDSGNKGDNSSDNSGGDEQTHVHRGEWTITKEATCTENGSRYRVCIDCGETETQVIQKKDHSYNAENVCTVCGDELQITVGLEYEEYTEESYPYNKYYAVTGMGIATDRDLVIPAYYMGKRVGKIAASAFSGKDAISSVYIANGLTEIESKAFYYCSSIEKLTLPTSIKKIGNEAFLYCSKLKACTLYDNVTEIGESAFSSCTQLSEINLPDKGLMIGVKAFYNTDFYNKKTNWTDGVLYSGNHLLATNETFKSESCTIPQNVKSLASSAFANQSALKEIVIEANSLTVGENVFSNTGLTKATVPYGCLGLLPANNITDLAVTSGSLNDELRGFTNLINLTVNYYFYRPTTYSPLQGLGKLESLTVKKLDGYRLGALFGTEYFSGSTLISQKSASYNSSTRNYTLSNTADSYYIPSSLRSVTVLSDKITPCAFYGCTMLTDVTYGKDVTMGYYALYGCTNVEYLNYLGDLENFCAVKKDIAFNYLSQDSNGIEHFATIKLNGNILQGEITIPSTVTGILDNAFMGQTKITKVNIPSNVTRIGKYVFYGCSGLTSVTIPDGVTSIGSYAFYGCSGLTSVTIPDGVTSIGDSTFQGCINLTSIAIPDNATSIGNRAFSGCKSLFNIKIPNSVLSVGRNAFYGCDKIFIINDDIQYVDKWAVGYINAPTNVIFRDGTVGMADGILSGCKTLVSVNLNGIEKISPSAFYSCSKLKTITIPGSLFSVGQGALGYCDNIEEVNIDNLSAWCALNFSSQSSDYTYGGGNPLSSGAKLYVKGQLVTDLVIPNDVESIGSFTFYNYSDLKSIIITPQVKSIGRYAFGGCTNVESIYFNAIDCYNDNDYAKYSEGSTVFNSVGRNTAGIELIIGKDVKQIPGSMFYGESMYSPSHTGSTKAPKISSVVFEENGLCEIISAYAFARCDSLESIVLPETMREIGTEAFVGCDRLKYISFPNSIENVYADAFDGCSSLECTYNNGIYYIGNDLNPYLVALKADKNTTSTEFTMLIDCKFYLFNLGSYFTKVQDLYFPGDIAEWANISFPGAWGENTPVGKTSNIYIDNNLITNITKIDLSTHKGALGAYAFAKWTWLEEVILPNNLEQVPIGIFYNCTSLKKISLPNNLKTINDYAFDNCKSLNILDLPIGLEFIGWSAFDSCKSLITLVIPDSIITLEDRAFSHCDNLKSVYYLGTVDDWLKIKNLSDSGLNSVKKFFYSEVKPILNDDNLDENGYSYWHYDADGITPVVWTKTE